MTIDEYRRLDAWVRGTTAGQPGLECPWRLAVDPHNLHGDLIVQWDPVEAGRRGLGPRADEVCRIPAGTSVAMACQAILGAIAGAIRPI